MLTLALVVSFSVAPAQVQIAKVVVALVDAEHQGVAPIKHPLYWGARYGLKTFLVKDKKWKFVSTTKGKGQSSSARCSKKTACALRAVAYRGAYMKDALEAYAKYQKISVKSGRADVH